MVIFVGKQSEFNLVFNLCSTEKSENRKRKLGIWEFSIAKKVIFFFLPWVFLLSTYLQQGNHIILCLLSLIFFLSRRLIPSVLSTLVPAYYFPHEVYIMATLRIKTAFPSPSTFHFLTSFVTGCVSSTMTTEQSFCSHEILSIRELALHEAVSRLCRPARTECWWKWESKAVIMIPNRRRKRASEAVAAFQIP